MATLQRDEGKRRVCAEVNLVQFVFSEAYRHEMSTSFHLLR